MIRWTLVITVFFITLFLAIQPIVDEYNAEIEQEWWNSLEQQEINNLDPTILEQAISKELHASDTYDIYLHYWVDSENITGDYSFTITGKAKPIRIDWSQFD